MNTTIKNYDVLAKILVIGDSGVGKTTLLNKIKKNIYIKNYHSTIGVDFISVYHKNKNNKIYKFTIWDTAGQERFRAVVKNFYRGIHGIILVFDLSDPNSFTELTYWLKEVEHNCAEKPYIMIIGNKNDLKKETLIDNKIIEHFCKTHNLDYLLISTKNDSGNKLNNKILGTLSQKINYDINEEAEVEELELTNNSIIKYCCSIQ